MLKQKFQFQVGDRVRTQHGAYGKIEHVYRSSPIAVDVEWDNGSHSTEDAGDLLVAFYMLPAQWDGLGITR